MDERRAGLPYLQRLLHLLLPLLADDDGNLRDDVEEITGKLFWAMKSGRPPVTEVRRSMTLLGSAGLLRRYQVNGLDYVQLLSWESVKNPGNPRVPGPEAEGDMSNLHTQMLDEFGRLWAARYHIPYIALPKDRALLGRLLLQLKGQEGVLEQLPALFASYVRDDSDRYAVTQSHPLGLFVSSFNHYRAKGAKGGALALVPRNVVSVPARYRHATRQQQQAAGAKK